MSLSLRSTVSDLRRRKVFRVVGVYLVGAWVVIQVVETVFPVLMIPDIFVRIVVVLAIVGAPVAAALAWAFDWTPEGLERTVAAPMADAPAGHGPDLSGDPASPEAAESSSGSLAVLPFEDLGPDGRAGHLADGIAEEILHAVARIPGLRVAARTSSFAFKGEGGDVREIGRRLGVEAVLEGTVRTDGNRLRVTAQLVDARDGGRIVSEAYDVRLDDVFRVQEEVAGKVAHALRFELGGDDRNGPDEGRTTADLDAYEEYLRGAHHLASRTSEGLRRALDHFERALERDPAFALPRAGRAQALALLADLGAVKPAVALPAAEEEADRALASAPDLVEAHAALGLVRTLAWRWEEAEGPFLRALELDGDHGDALQWYAVFLTAHGRLDEALKHLERARTLDPLSGRVHASLSVVNLYRRRYDAALERATQARQLSPDDTFARVLEATVHEFTGEPERARALLRERSSRRPNPLTVAALGHVEATLGVRPAARRALQELDALSRKGRPTGFCAAAVHAALGDREAAFSALERAVAEHDGWIPALPVHPWIDPIRGDTRYSELLASVGLEVGAPAAAGEQTSVPP